MDTAIKKRPVIALEPCVSSRIAAHGYDAATSTLALQFKKKVDGEMVPGPVYHYAGVAQSVYDQLKASDSIGRFYGKVIAAKDDEGKVVYPYTRIDDTEEPR